MEADEGAATGDAPVPAPVFKKPNRNKNVRQRPSAAAEEEVDGSAVMRASKAAKVRAFVSSTSKDTSKPAMGAELAHASDRRISNYDNKATATNEQDVAREHDAQSQFERAQALRADEAGEFTADGTKVYRGQAAYRQYTGTAESFDSAVMGGHGPARAPVHYRATSRFDYQPDICKDFKDTGYCGYGDACKFLHDRSDYKSGWQLEQQWDEEQKKKRAEDALAELEGVEPAKPEAEDNLPFACLICHEPWHAKSRPVATKCEHYFCEACALRHAAKTRRCYVCAEQTHGIFNTAKLIQEKIDAREAAKAAQAALQAGEEQSTEDIMAEYEAERARKETRKGNAAGWGIL